MPWLTAGMTLVPSAMPTSMAPWPTSVDEVRVDLVLELDVEAGVARSSRPGRRGRTARTGRSGCSRGRRSAWSGAALAAPDGRLDAEAPAGDSGPTADPSTLRRARRRRARRAAMHGTAMSTGDLRWTMTGPPGGTDGLIGRRPAGARRGRRRGRARCPASAIVRSVANMSGMSNSDPRARLMRTPRPLLGAGPLPDDRAHDGERDADAETAEDRRQRRRDLERGQHLATGRAERAAELEQPGIDRPDADHRGDRDREEHDQGADHDLADEARPEPQREQRREREDRRRLGRDEIRREHPLDERAARERVADEERRARRRRRSPSATSTSVAAKCGSMVPSGQAVDEPRDDGLGRRQDERRVAADDDDRLPGERRTRRARRRPGAATPRLMTRAPGASGSRRRCRPRRRRRGPRWSAAAARRPRCRPRRDPAAA